MKEQILIWEQKAEKHSGKWKRQLSEKCV